LQLLMQFSCF